MTIIDQANINLPELLSRVEHGEEIIISNQGIPIAKLIPFQPAFNRRSSLGQDQHRFTVPENFNDPLPENLLIAFEGGAE
ncbi:type II toxin-antitoxin system prevent-host-death family antitoxin [Spirulina sp. CCNP1310]|uniref:type II toxin-antitoxin system Phd/YefM family antitoxin n=1 Tax=Spirulina sp. CCNP1310 TaxID=3110249 RepID=UPI002B365C68|nr:type II toxin-antitoxin system prevent-host-death family antitoxin [Spirulina sp. CCNP1310]